MPRKRTPGHSGARTVPPSKPFRKKTSGKRTPRKKALKSPASKNKSLTTKKKTLHAPVSGRGSSAQLSVIEAVLATFAHEVRTPLTGVLAISDLLATSDLGERERRWVETIKASAEHLSALATLFVDAARSKASALTLRHDVFDLRVLLRTAADSLVGRAAAKGLSTTIAVAEDLPLFVLGDAVRLRAALENLIDNAVKFTAAGAIVMTVHRARAPKDKAGIHFALADSGVGISAAELRRLFRPFSQANVSIAQRFGGAGLGLSSVRQLARAMGGDVTVAAQRTGGAVFTLTAMLDLAPEAEDAADDIAFESPRALRILSVEDNPFGRVVLNAILQELGHQTEFIGRGEDAGDRLAQGGFDLVLMDMVLPGINGVEAIRRIRARTGGLGRIPIIGVSGRDSDEKPALAAGADAFLLKPVSPRALAQTVARILRSRHASAIPRS